MISLATFFIFLEYIQQSVYLCHDFTKTFFLKFFLNNIKIYSCLPKT